MAISQQSSVDRNPRQHQTSLATSLVRTLIIFTLIPLTLIAGAIYFRSRTLLRDQVINQMQVQLTTQLSQMDLSIKTKEIRLDRLVRSPDFTVDYQASLQNNPQSEQFASVRDNLATDLRMANPQSGQS